MRRSVYDNLPPSEKTSRSESVRRLTDEQTGQVVSIVRDQSDLDRYTQEEYRNVDVRVTQLANHITYVTIGDDEEFSKV